MALGEVILAMWSALLLLRSSASRTCLITAPNPWKAVRWCLHALAAAQASTSCTPALPRPPAYARHRSSPKRSLAGRTELRRGVMLWGNAGTAWDRALRARSGGATGSRRLKVCAGGKTTILFHPGDIERSYAPVDPRVAADGASRRPAERLIVRRTRERGPDANDYPRHRRRSDREAAVRSSGEASQTPSSRRVGRAPTSR